MPKKSNSDVPPDDTPDDGLFDDEADEQQQDDLAPAAVAEEQPSAEPAPQMAVHAGGFLEYRAPDGAAWRCDRVAELFTDFNITGSDAQKHARLTEWHQVMSAVPVSWKMLRRWYRAAPLSGSLTADDLREWTRAELAAALGFSESLLDAQLAETRDFWQRVQMEKELAVRLVEHAGEKALTEEDIVRLVKKHGFGSVPVQLYPKVAERVMEMSHLFDLPEGRMLAQSAIFQELMIITQQDKIGKLMQGGDANLSKEYKELQSLQTTYEGTLDKLGATQDQNPNFRQRVAFNDCMGQVTKGMQAWYADGDNTIIDGIFTASEVQIQITPTTLRTAQYRPDLTLLIAEWKREFWNPNYGYDAEGAEVKTTGKLPREVMRKLLRGFEEGVRAQSAENGEALADMDDSAGGETLEMAEAALRAPVDESESQREAPAEMPDGSGVLPEDAAGPRRGAKDAYVPI
jgi:hypothetical protein